MVIFPVNLTPNFLLHEINEAGARFTKKILRKILSLSQVFPKFILSLS